MKTAILYSRLTYSPACYPVRRDGYVIYVRMKVVRCHYSEALDKAKPRKGETVLNCVPLDVSAMSRTKQPARPYFTVKHEHDAALQAYIDAASMLYSAVRTGLALARTPEAALNFLTKMKEHADNFQRAAYGDE